MEKNIDISVIVPIYNVEEYLEECLNSIKNSTKKNIEIIMINDGSTDDSGKIAEKFAKNNENFYYYYEENKGLGHARNYGVSLAKGKYIAFVDSDDIISHDMYEKLYNEAEKNNSDLAICNVARFNSKNIWASSLQKRIFANCNIIENTHITKCPDLIYDTTSWNKIILHSFYKKNNFSFPEGILYEDIPVIIPMHYKANNVSIVQNTYYFWRVRDGKDKSITQNNKNIQNLTDRIKILIMTEEILKKNDVECKVFHNKVLRIDLLIYINLLEHLSHEEITERLDIINNYLKKYIDDNSFKELSILNQQKYIYVKEYEIDKLIELIQYGKNNYYHSPIEEKNGQFYIDLPNSLFSISDRNVTKELQEYYPHKYIHDIATQNHNTSIEIFAHIYIPRVNVTKFSDQYIEAYLENELTGKLTKLKLEPTMDNITTNIYGTVFDSFQEKESKYNYDYIGFKIFIDLNELKVDKYNQGKNKILLKYKNRLVENKARLSSDKKTKENTAILLNNNYLNIEYDPLKEIVVNIAKNVNYANNITIQNSYIYIYMEKRIDLLYMEDCNGNILTFTTNDNISWKLPIDKLDYNLDYIFYMQNNNYRENLLYKTRKLIINTDSNLLIRTLKDHKVRCLKPAHNITLAKNIINNEKLINIKTTKLLSKNSAEPTKANLYLLDNITGGKTILSKANCKIKNGNIVCNFNIDFNNNKTIKNLYSGTRDLFISYDNEDGKIISDVIYSEKYKKYIINLNNIEITCNRNSFGNIQLKSKKCWNKEENTKAKRTILTNKMYPIYRKEKINKRQIMFESMWGKKYSCNPQHLYEYINEKYPEYECIWSLNDECTPIKGEAKRVRRGSQEYYKYLATSKFFVNNVNFEDAFVKREEQIEIQTMHGTPLKTLGLDVKEDFPNENSKKNFLRKCNRWDYLLVQGNFVKEKAYSIFHFDKKVLEYGYPRTDILFNVTNEEKIKIKKTLRFTS